MADHAVTLTSDVLSEAQALHCVVVGIKVAHAQSTDWSVNYIIPSNRCDTKFRKQCSLIACKYTVTGRCLIAGAGNAATHLHAVGINFN